VLVLEGPAGTWTCIDPANQIWLEDHGCFASSSYGEYVGIYEVHIDPLAIIGPAVDPGVYVLDDGNYALAAPYEGEIGPGSSSRISFEISVNPALAPGGVYTFHILAVTPYSEVADWYTQVYGEEPAAAIAYIGDIIARLPAAPD